MRKQLERIGLQVDERAAQQAHVAHGLRQHELRKTLAQQLRHAPRLRTDWLHETQPQARDRRCTMTQLHFDRLQTTATLAQELAPALYRTVWEKLRPLPGHTILYPGHGAGSLCRHVRTPPATSAP